MKVSTKPPDRVLLELPEANGARVALDLDRHQAFALMGCTIPPSVSASSPTLSSPISSCAGSDAIERSSIAAHSAHVIIIAVSLPYSCGLVSGFASRDSGDERPRGQCREIRPGAPLCRRRAGPPTAPALEHSLQMI
jgi:hypothetical protein